MFLCFFALAFLATVMAQSYGVPPAQEPPYGAPPAQQQPLYPPQQMYPLKHKRKELAITVAYTVAGRSEDSKACTGSLQHIKICLEEQGCKAGDYCERETSCIINLRAAEVGSWRLAGQPHAIRVGGSGKSVKSWKNRPKDYNVRMRCAVALMIPLPPGWRTPESIIQGQANLGEFHLCPYTSMDII
ncbi:hypothetical protein ANCCEY_00316 [Ancylostoma ceylanicum]|uniref:Uncharacterized protein n=1 Tax=Ancylostoma ceylanicum TaxID=53326 RepID=A0A0D6MDG1_9BILA|nr:hypothetical protein ANCCEY_00316 [Ancylostoma ceylanicum]